MLHESWPSSYCCFPRTSLILRDWIIISWLKHAKNKKERKWSQTIFNPAQVHLHLQVRFAMALLCQDCQIFPNASWQDGSCFFQLVAACPVAHFMPHRQRGWCSSFHLHGCPLHCQCSGNVSSSSYEGHQFLWLGEQCQGIVPWCPRNVFSNWQECNHVFAPRYVVVGPHHVITEAPPSIRLHEIHSQGKGVISQD